MLPIDGHVMLDVAPRVSGAKADKQAKIIGEVGPVLQQTLASYDIDTRLRIAHFLGQTCEESDGFCTTVEYGSGRNYQGLLGNTQPGDGPRYKGRGLIQLTGRDNYRDYGKALGLNLVDDPDLAAEPKLSLTIACEFWKRHNLNDDADRDDVVRITRKINGGLNGLADRRTYTARAKAALARIEALQAGGTTAAGDPVLHRGSTGDTVGELQERLRDLGFPIAIDQDFGPATEVAVSRFQSQNGITPSGIVDAATWTKLKASTKPSTLS